MSAKPVTPPTTCQHLGCGRAIKHVGLGGYEHVDNLGGHVVDLGDAYRTEWQARFNALKKLRAEQEP